LCYSVIRYWNTLSSRLFIELNNNEPLLKDNPLELSWSTFLLEIINFLVLVWILKHFLYKPVLNIIERRRTGIENQLTEAQQLQEKANDLKTEYENRLADWDQERQQLRDTLARELDAERARQIEALQDTLAQEREKAQVAESRQRAEAEREIEHRALQQGAKFATRLLSQAAGQALETRLCDILIDGLAALSSDRLTALRTQWGEPPKHFIVTSVFPLSPEQRQQLEEVLGKVTGLAVPVVFEQNPELLAGLRITIGAWVLHANLQDELKGFSEFALATR
jgi:F-type H+-transporting ATPase subunit b